MFIREFFYKKPEMILIAAGSAGSFLLFIIQRAFGVPSFSWAALTMLYIALAIAAGMAIRSLYQSAHIDGLTTLWNRRYFELRLTEELQRLKRTNSPLCIALIDTDSFKDVNDAYGHVTGDTLLCKIAIAIKRNTRQFDIPCRWGGDEFAIIFPETNIAGALAVAERIRTSVDSRKTCFYSTTLSIGIVQVGEKDDAAGILHEVDKALYKAKELRNTVYIGTCHSPGGCVPVIM